MFNKTLISTAWLKRGPTSNANTVTGNLPSSQASVQHAAYISRGKVANVAGIVPLIPQIRLYGMNREPYVNTLSY